MIAARPWRGHDEKGGKEKNSVLGTWETPSLHFPFFTKRGNSLNFFARVGKGLVTLGLLCGQIGVERVVGNWPGKPEGVEIGQQGTPGKGQDTGKPAAKAVKLVTELTKPAAWVLQGGKCLHEEVQDANFQSMQKQCSCHNHLDFSQVT